MKQLVQLTSLKRSAELAATTEMPLETGDTVLDYISNFMAFLYRGDPSQSAKACAIKFVMLKAAMTDECSVTIDGEHKKLKGLSMLREEIKRHIFRSANLQPRMSDPDLLQKSMPQAGQQPQDGAVVDDKKKETTDSEILEFIGDHAEQAACMGAFLNTTNLQMPFWAHPWASELMNNSMMSLLQAGQAYHMCVWPSARDAYMRLMEIVAKEVNAPCPLNGTKCSTLSKRLL